MASEPNPSVVAIIGKVLRDRLSTTPVISLSELIHAVDHLDKTVPTVAEVNLALEQAPALRVSRAAGVVQIGHSGTGRMVTAREMTDAVTVVEREVQAFIAKSRG